MGSASSGRGIQGQMPGRTWIDEALFPSPEPERRWYDHLFDHDANAETNYIAGTDQKTVQLWWCWVWTEFELGIGTSLERPGYGKPGSFAFWVNLGPLSFGFDVNLNRWRS